MLIIAQPKNQKFAKFSKTSSIFIKNIVSVDGLTIFFYSIPIEIDQKKIGGFSGDLIVSAYTSQKRRQAISLKRSDISSGNILKKISNQKITQDKELQNSKKYIFRKYVDRPDLSLSQIVINAEIPDIYIDDTFNVEISSVGTDGRVVFFDSIQINHSKHLSDYDLPTSNFTLTTTRSNKKTIYAAATTNDPKIGYFVFSIRKDSSFSFSSRRFELEKEIEVEPGGIATVSFSVDDVDQSYTVRAYPVSRILRQKIGNYKEESLSFIQSAKQLPFYVADVKNDFVSFAAQGIDQTINKIILYRRNFIRNEREYVENKSQLGGLVSITDTGRIPQYDYIYDFDYIDDSGILQTSSTEVLVPAMKLDNLAKISVTATGSQESDRTGKISFNVNVEYDTSTSYDQVVADLKTLGLESLISDDLKKMTNNLKPITRVIVSKISRLTGMESDIGVFQPGSITISDALNEPCIFRFEVAVRSAPEILESLASGQNVISDNSFNLKSLPDLASKSIGNRSKTRNTSFSSKFFTKQSIRDSTLRYGDASSLSDLSYYSGRTGVFADYLYAPLDSKTSSRISSVSTIKNDDGTFLTWSYSGNTSTVEFFNIDFNGETRKSAVMRFGIQTFFLGKISVNKVRISAIGLDQTEITSVSAEIK